MFVSEHSGNLTNLDLLNWYEKDEITLKNSDILKAVSELKQLLEYCDLFGILSTITIEPSLARGLDYYTGAIFEVILKGSLVFLSSLFPFSNLRSQKLFFSLSTILQIIQRSHRSKMLILMKKCRV